MNAPGICAARFIEFARECFGLAVLLSVSTVALVARAEPGSINAIALGGAVSSVRMPFIENAGQVDSAVAFYAPTFAGTLHVTREGRLVYALPGRREVSESTDTGASSAAVLPGTLRMRGWTLIESFVGGAPRPRAGTRSVTNVSHFIGSAERHRTEVATFADVRLGEVFDGVDVNLRATGNNVEKIFTVAPGVHPARIRMRLDGATAIRLAADGSLLAATGNGDVAFTPPVAFQTINGVQRPVVARYVLAAEPGTYGFEVDAYDTAEPLVIDPLLQATYVGGSGSDQINAIAIHPNTREVYVAGTTTSSGSSLNGVNLNGGGAQATYGGNPSDIFVSRFSADLKTLLQSTYLGAAGEDVATAMTISGAGDAIYVTGYTAAPMSTFPGVGFNGGGAQTTFGGGAFDAVVTRLSANLRTLVQSTYLGAGGTDKAAAIVVHPASGDVLVTGRTDATAATFPGVGLNGGGAQATSGGLDDAFVTRLSPDLKTLVQSTYVGGTGADYASTILVHPLTDEIYIAGAAGSGFPVSGGVQPVFGGGASDAFIARLHTSLKVLSQSTYFGGAGADEALALAFIPNPSQLTFSELFVAGSTDGGLPGTSPFAVAFGGGTDGFVARYQFNGSLNSTPARILLGSANLDRARAIAIHPGTRDIFVAGETGATGTTFPGTANGAQSTSGGGSDAFVTRFDRAFSSLLQSTYFGSAGAEAATAMAFRPESGELYIAGLTDAPAASLPGVALNGGAAQASNAGGIDGFIARFSADLLAADVYPDPFSFAPRLGAPPGSVQTTIPTVVTGFVGTLQVRIQGTGAQFCVTSAADCACVFSATPATVSAGQFVCVQQPTSFDFPAVTKATLFVGSGQADFIVATGSVFIGCTLDIDGNNAIDALTDGLLLIRAMFGLTGTAVTNGAVAAQATRNTWALVQQYLNGNCGTNFAQ